MQRVYRCLEGPGATRVRTDTQILKTGRVSRVSVTMASARAPVTVLSLGAQASRHNYLHYTPLIQNPQIQYQNKYTKKKQNTTTIACDYPHLDSRDGTTDMLMDKHHAALFLLALVRRKRRVRPFDSTAAALPLAGLRRISEQLDASADDVARQPHLVPAAVLCSSG